MILTNSTAIDLHLRDIIASLDSVLPGFDRLYGRLPVEAVKGLEGLPKGEKEKPRRIPLWHDAEKKTSLPVLPDETKGGLGFFITTGPAKPLDLQPGWSMFSPTQNKEYPMALILWWNREKSLAHAGPVRTPDEIRQAVEFKLGLWYDWLTESVDDQLATRVFRDLDYDFDKYPYLLYPYCGLRIEGTLTITEYVCVN